METKEIWKDIPNYEGYYQVSNLGRVKNLKRFVKAKSNSTRLVKERILKIGVDGAGYLVVDLNKDGKGKTFKVHKLVAMAFLGHKPCGYKEVIDHFDNNKFNNKLENLQITTNRHNSTKDRKGGTSKYTGVSWDKNANKWVCKIYINGKQNYLGLFENELDANNAYQNALKKLGGYNG